MHSGDAGTIGMVGTIGKMGKKEDEASGLFVCTAGTPGHTGNTSWRYWCDQHKIATFRENKIHLRGDLPLHIPLAAAFQPIRLPDQRDATRLCTVRLSAINFAFSRFFPQKKEFKKT